MTIKFHEKLTQPVSTKRPLLLRKAQVKRYLLTNKNFNFELPRRRWSFMLPRFRRYYFLRCWKRKRFSRYQREYTAEEDLYRLGHRKRLLLKEVR